MNETHIAHTRYSPYTRSRRYYIHFMYVSLHHSQVWTELLKCIVLINHKVYNDNSNNNNKYNNSINSRAASDSGSREKKEEIYMHQYQSTTYRIKHTKRHTRNCNVSALLDYTTQFQANMYKRASQTYTHNFVSAHPSIRRSKMWSASAATARYRTAFWITQVLSVYGGLSPIHQCGSFICVSARSPQPMCLCVTFECVSSSRAQHKTHTCTRLAPTPAHSRAASPVYIYSSRITVPSVSRLSVFNYDKSFSHLEKVVNRKIKHYCEQKATKTRLGQTK